MITAQQLDVVSTNGSRFGQSLSDFELIKTLGTGTFGRVYLCKIQKTERYFAMKTLRKVEIVRLRQVEHINSEKNILAKIKHPFIVNLLCTFQDEVNVYMLEEYVVGGEMFSHLRRAGRFSNEMTKFYAAQITLALEYLHSMDIIYRDLKPENLLLDQDGNIKIADFGFAKFVPDVTWTLCGTPEYLAPEIIQSKGHGKAVDWWALGILIFEMLAGYPPFFDDTPFGIYEKIIMGRIAFPPHFDPYAKDIVKRFLTSDRSKRLGNLFGGAADVKNHKWFAAVDWNAVLERAIRAPIVPVCAHPGDTRNFESYPETDVHKNPAVSLDPFQHLFKVLLLTTGLLKRVSEFAQMSLLSIKIFFTDLNQTKTCQYLSDMYVKDICKDLRAKYGYGDGGLDNGLLAKEQGIWLAGNKMLGQYELKHGETLEFRKKHRVLKVKTLDESIKAIIVDESQPVRFVVETICERIGLANADEYSLLRPEAPKKPEKGKPTVEKQDWLNPDKTFREQGLTEVDVVVLKKKFFFSDQNVDRSDPVQLVLMYNQSKEMILTGKLPITVDEAIQFAAIQMQVDFGNHDPDKHKSGFLKDKLKLLVPPEYYKSKDLEKKIYVEHRKLTGTTDLNAKFRYVQLIRSMKSYGVSFFLVKEPIPKSKKTQDVLLGVTKQAIVRLEVDTKNVLTEWKLTQLRRWAATPKSFTLDFGDYAEKFYQVETLEGEQISRLISGYIDIIIKKRNQMAQAAMEAANLEEQAVIEDYVQPAKANNVAIMNNSAMPKQARQVTQSTDNLAMYSQPVQSMNAEQRVVQVKGEMATDIGLLEAQEQSLQNLKSALGLLQTFERDLYAPTLLPPMGNDPVALKWRQETAEINAEAVMSHIASNLAALSALVMYANGDPDEMDFDAIDDSVSKIASSLAQLSQAFKMLSGLSPSELEAEELLSVGRSVVHAQATMLQNLESIVEGKGGYNRLYTSATAVGAICSQALAAINRLDVSEDNQNELLDAAQEVSNAVQDLANLVRQNEFKINKEELDHDVGVCEDAAAIVGTVTSVVACVVATPLCREQLVESAVLMRDAVAALRAHDTRNTDQDLKEALENAIAETEDALAYLVEKARNVDNDIDFEIEAFYNQLVGAADDLSKNIDDLEAMIPHAKELTVNGSRFVEVLKSKASLLEDGNEKKNLETDAAQLSNLISQMVVQARQVVANKDEDPDAGKEELLTVIDDIKELATVVATPYIKSNSTQKLIQALKSSIACSNNVIGAGKQAGPSNRDQNSQVNLNRAGKRMTDVIPEILGAIQYAKSCPKDFIARYKLMKSTALFFDPAASLVSAAKTASSTTVETSSQTQLLNAAQQMAEELIHLQKLLATMQQMSAGEDVTFAIEPIGRITKGIIQLKNGEKGVVIASPEVVTAESEITQYCKKMEQAVDHLVKAVKAKDFAGAQADFVQIVSDYEKLSKPLEKPTSSMDPSMAQGLKSAAIALSEALNELVNGTKSAMIRNDAAQAQKAAEKTNQALQKLLENLPSNQKVKSVRRRIQDISGTFGKLGSPTVTTPVLSSPLAAKYSQENPEKLLWSAAADLTNATQTLISASQSKDINESAAVMEKGFDNLVQALQIITKKSGTDAVHIKPFVSGIGLQCDYFLDSLKLASNNPDNSIAKHALVNAAKSVQESVDTMLASLSLNLPGQQQYNKAAEILNQTTSNLENINKPKVVESTYAHEIVQISETTQTLNDKIQAFQHHVQANDKQNVAEAVVDLASSIQLVVGSSLDAAYLLATLDQPELTQTTRNGEYDELEQDILAIQGAMANVIKPTKTQQEIIQEVGVIAKKTGDICGYLKTKSVEKGLDQPSREKYSELAQKTAKSISPYVNSLKNLAMNRTDEARFGCNEASVPFNECLAQIMQFVSNRLKDNQVPIAQATIIKQAPVLQMSKIVLDKLRAVHVASRTFATNNEDDTLKAQLLDEIELLSKANQQLVEAVKQQAPGQKECEAVSEKITQVMQTLDQPLIEGEVVNCSLKDLHDQLQVLSNLTDVVAQSSQKDVSALIDALEDVPQTFAHVAKISKAVEYEDPSQKLNVAEALEIIGNALKQYTQAVKQTTLESNNAQVNEQKEALKKAITQASALVLDKNDPEAIAVDEASKDIEFKFNNLQQLLSESVFNPKASVELDQHGKKLVQALATGVLGKQALGQVARTMAEHYHGLLQATGSVVKNCEDDDLKARMIDQVREIGGSTLKALALFAKEKDQTAKKKQMGEISKEITFKLARLNESVQESQILHNASVELCNGADSLIAELDTSLIFATAMQLSPVEETDTFILFKDDALMAAQLLTENVKQLMNGSLNQTQAAKIFKETLTALQDLTKSASRSAAALTSENSQMQEKLLELARSICEASKSMALALEASLGKPGDSPESVEFKEKTDLQLTSIKDLVKIIKDIGEQSGTDENIQQLNAELDRIMIVLTSSDHALGSALPADVTQFAKALATASALFVAAALNKPDDIPNCANKLRVSMEDLARSGKAVVAGAPEEVRNALIQAVVKCANAVKKMVGATQIVADANTKKQNLQMGVKEVSMSVMAVVQTAGTLVPDGYVDPNDPNVIAERELLSAANAIDAAAKKLALLRPPERPREADTELRFDEQILEAAKAIANATHVLVKSATSVQRELVARGRQGKVEGAYFNDGTWNDGLVSAAKLVVEATQDLCEAANQVAKDQTDVEYMTVSARKVASATVHLIAAATVKSEASSQAHMKLRAAGKSVTDATDRLVSAAEVANPAKEEEVTTVTTSNPTATRAKIMEMEAQVSILKMEKELERARQGLASIRKGKYSAVSEPKKRKEAPRLPKPENQAEQQQKEPTAL